MATKTKQHYTLIDEHGEIWASAELSDARLKAILKDYAKLDIYLTPKELKP
jgi:hypothetical protein